MEAVPMGISRGGPWAMLSAWAAHGQPTDYRI